ncbi:MAG: glycosyltransferase family 4 protein [Mycobacterium sp.]|nr:glycosyltransferase family 4 protein [Mycobacterium sp.]
MRILMLIDSYPPMIGGAQQYVRNLSIALVARGHDVAVATLAGPGLEPYEEDAGVRVYRLRGTLQRSERIFRDRTHAPPIPDPELVGEIRDVVRRERPDVVHSHNWMGRSFLPIKGSSQAKLVATVHDYNMRCANWILMRDGEPCAGPGPVKCLSCATISYSGVVKGTAVAVGNWATAVPERRMVDMFIPVSEAVAIGNGLAGGSSPYRIIPNFIPDTVGDLGDESYRDRLPADGYLLFVGSLTRQKGVETLLDAYAGLAGAPPLVLVGYTLPESPKSFPDNVIVLKNWPHTAVMTAWRHSLAGIVPSIWPDPCPGVAMEAMAAGKPVIASRIGGLPEIVADGETGIVVEPGDSDALRTAMATLVDDPTLAARMGAAGRERVTAFHASTVVGQIESVYREVLG